MRRLAHQARNQVRPLENAMTATNEQIAAAMLVTSADADVIHAVDARELKGRVTKRLPGLDTVAIVIAGDLDKWLAARATDSSNAAP